MPTVPLKGQAAQAPGRTPARQTNQTVSARHHPEVGGYTTGVRSGGASSSNYHSGEATLPRMYSEERLCDQAYPRFSVFKSISPPLIVPPTNVVAVAWVFPFLSACLFGESIATRKALCLLYPKLPRTTRWQSRFFSQALGVPTCGERSDAAIGSTLLGTNPV